MTNAIKLIKDLPFLFLFLHTKYIKVSEDIDRICNSTNEIVLSNINILYVFIYTKNMLFHS